MKTIRSVGVVGSGTMGSALAQKFAQEGFSVTLLDKDSAAVERGMNNIRQMLNEGLSKKVFSEEQVKNTLGNITPSTDRTALKVCDLIIEAVFEDFNVKSDLLRELSALVPETTILATNTSSFAVSDLARSVNKPERFIGLHYFYHAAKNRLVEIIPGEKTSLETTEAVHRFSVLSGKDPIYTADVFGFAVNRFFVPWLNESVRLMDETGCSPDTIDAIAMKAFGIGMGPFALMNATGVPIALHAQRTLQAFGPSYAPAQALIKQVERKEVWKLNGTADIHVSPETEAIVRDRLLGVVFFIASQILDTKVCTAAALDRGAKIGLKWKLGPVEMMSKKGRTDVERLVKSYVTLYKEQMPRILEQDWQMQFVHLKKKGDVALITVDRPEDLNALNEKVVKQLDVAFSEADADPMVNTIYLTGSGKAFVAGADIKFFVKHIKANTIPEIVKFTEYGQKVFDKIDRSKKRVVALVNGLALGGGLELALCADEIYLSTKAVLAFPETGIGIYPGLGGTQRPVRRVGKGIAKYLVLTGKMLNATDALECGLVDGVGEPSEIADMPDTGRKPSRLKAAEPGLPWKKRGEWFDKFSAAEIIIGKTPGFDGEEIKKMASILSAKAPVAVRLAEQLINDARGPASELELLTKIFHTSDALLGLTNIGKKVSYSGA